MSLSDRAAACTHEWITERPASATTSYEVCRRCGATREVPSAATTEPPCDGLRCDGRMEVDPFCTRHGDVGRSRYEALLDAERRALDAQAEADRAWSVLDWLSENNPATLELCPYKAKR